MSDHEHEFINDKLKELYTSFLNELTKDELINRILEEDPQGKEDDRFRDSIA